MANSNNCAGWGTLQSTLSQRVRKKLGRVKTMKENKVLGKAHVLILSILFVFVLVGYAFAANYYVNGSAGSDSYNGLYQTYQGGSNGPWKTLGKANTTVTSGTHTINVAAGTYAESVTETHSGSNASNRLIWLASGVVNVNRFIITGNYVTIDGFKFTGQNSVSNGLIYVDADYVEIKNCLIKDNTVAQYHPAILLTTNADHCTVDNNEIDNWSLATSPCMQIHGTYNTISNNTFHNIEGSDGIHIFGDHHIITGNYAHTWTQPAGSSPHMDFIQTSIATGKAALTNFLIEKNFIYWPNMMQRAGHPGDGVCFFMVDGSSTGIVRNNIAFVYTGINLHTNGAMTQNIEVYNNTFVADLAWHVFECTSPNWVCPSGIAIGTPGYANNITIRNNIFVDYYFSHIRIDGGTGNTADYNLKYNSNGSTPGGQTQQAHDVWKQDPKLVGGYSAATGYQLQSSSPAIGVGVTLTTQVPTDYWGTARPRGAAYDIGASKGLVDISPPVGLMLLP